MLLATATSSFAQEPNTRETGYRGIWFTLGQLGEYGDKYSGGLGTYTAKHRPTAIYAPAARKTFFVYGGAKDEKRHLLNMIGVYDHDTGEVERPVIVHDRGGVDDPHDNASLAIDDEGYLWVFVSGRARGRPGFIYRSDAPYDIASFAQISEREITYPQPVWVPENGFLHCFTKYTKGRELYWSTSIDGRAWTPDQKLAGMGGHYQVTESRDGVEFTAFNYHPGGNVDKRTNLYFAKTSDMGKTWTTVDGRLLDTPLTDTKCAALVHDFEAEGRLVYMKDMQFDSDGRPVILIVTSSDHMPGPQGDPRTWTIIRWDGARWIQRVVTRSTHNYDMGQLWIEDTLWRIVAPTEPGPQRWGTGGEIAIWESTDSGDSWAKTRTVTRDSRYNQSYVRRPINAQADFYAFWADGDPDEQSPSRLYFMNRSGERVFRMPSEMTGDIAKPERVR